jgi:hypothetical protein
LVKPVIDKPYAQVLKELKDNVDADACGVKIHKVEKTNSGGLRIKLTQAKNTGLENFRQAVEEKLGKQAEDAVAIVTKKKQLIIKDIEPTITADEIQIAIKQALNDKDARFTVRLSKNSYYNGMRLATITLPISSARQLAPLKKIKIGWGQCRVEEKLMPIRCLRCSKYGHTAQTCTENIADTGKGTLCFKCGQRGHLARACEHGQRCYLCNSTEHQAGSWTCSEYKKLT